MRLTLVRHGETQWNKEKKIQGITDVELNEVGLEQADRLSLALKKESFDRIITSPLKRAHRTAQAIGRYHALPILVNPDLRELNAGEFEGLSFPDILARYPDFLPRWMEDHASVAMPRGESLQEVQNRAWPVIQEVTETCRHALVVAHSFVIMTILCKIQNLNLSETSKVRIGIASRTSLEYNNGSTQILIFNDTTHLQDSRQASSIG